MNGTAVARELAKAARELVSASEWDARESRINLERLLPLQQSYRDLLFDMMQAGVVSEAEYHRAVGNMFRAADKMRKVVIGLTRRDG
jgi:hypothetical protein